MKHPPFLRTLTLLTLICALSAEITGSPDSTPSGLIYYKHWEMVKLFPRPKDPLTQAERIQLQESGAQNLNYVTAVYSETGLLMTITEISNNRQKIKFDYIYDKTTVTQINLTLPNGDHKIYYKK